jgi:hypothetical protein
MNSFKNIEVKQNKKKVSGKFVWILTYILDGVELGQTTHSVKQNRLEQMAFNFCLDNNVGMTHPSTF